MLDTKWNPIGIEAVLLSMWIRDEIENEGDGALDFDELISLLDLIDSLNAKTTEPRDRYQRILERLCKATYKHVSKESRDNRRRELEEERAVQLMAQ